MSKYVHAIKRKNGNYSYRGYIDNTDIYYTPPLSEQEMRFFLLVEAAYEGLDQLNSSAEGISKRLQRAREKGTSSKIEEETRSLTRWDAQLILNRTQFLRKQTKAEFMAEIKKDLATSLEGLIRKNLSKDFFDNGTEYGRLIEALDKYT